jgi:hypothetical protein
MRCADRAVGAEHPLALLPPDTVYADVCTITLAWQTFEDAPVIVAANRDEVLDRPSDPPERREWEQTVVAPKDAEAEGTWIGYNEHGVLVALTNRWTGEEKRGDRSRGLLVRDALGYESAEEAIRCVERDLDNQTYEGFNLLAVDRNSALLVEYDGIRRVRNLEPGVHVIVNVGADDNYEIPAQREAAGIEQAENATGLREALTPEPGETGREWLDRASEAISDHEYGVCLHRDGFGTRSSSLIYLGDDVSYHYADGPPCRTPYKPVLADLDVDRS